MDLIILLVVCGCAIAGLISGALRMLALVAALVAAVLAGRFAGPAAAELVSGAAPPPGVALAAAVVVGLLAAVVVWLAGVGLRRGLAAVHLGWLDRLAGMALGAATAAAIMAVLLALASIGGHDPASPWAARLSRAARPFLEPHSSPVSRAIPTASPTRPTSSGQHPH